MSAIQATVGTQTEVIDAVRPRFSDLWNSYPVGMAAGDVYKLVGGNAYALYKENPADYANACALRLSRALNYGGLTITSTATGYKVNGDDEKLYLLRVKDMISFVKANFGAPDMEIDTEGLDQSWAFREKKGVLIFNVSGWDRATGHVTLWNGSDCGDSCYFFHHQPGVVTTSILFWELK